MNKKTKFGNVGINSDGYYYISSKKEKNQDPFTADLVHNLVKKEIMNAEDTS